MTPTHERLSFIVDWDRDGTYDHALSNITSYVVRAEWTLGFQEPYQPMGGPSQLLLTLDNDNGAWNVLDSSSTFYNVIQGEALVQIRYSSGTTWYLGTYKTVGLKIDPGRHGGRYVTLVAQDWYDDFMSITYDPPLTTDTHTGDAIRNAFEDVGVPGFPLGALNFIVDASTLDETTKLPDYFGEGYINTFQGQTQLEYVGDNIDTGSGITLANFIREMCEAEMVGRWRFQINTANGRPCYSYYARTTLAEYADDGNTHVIDTDDFYNATYLYNENLCNWLEVTFYPRAVGDAGTEIAHIESPLSIPGLGSRVFTLRYRDPSNPDGVCAATTIIQPVASTDYTGNLESDGSGEDYTSNLVVTVENLTNAAKVTVNNTALGAVYLTLLNIRGTPLTASQPIQLRSIDGSSTAAYGIRKLTKTVAGVNDEELVQSYADWFVHNWGQPRAEYRSITFDYNEQTDAGLATYVYEPLSDTEPLIITDNWTEGASTPQSYWVCGMHSVVQSGVWEVTLILENYLNMSGYWQLENAILGILDETTRLAF